MTKEELISKMAKVGDENIKRVQDLLDDIKGKSGRIADLIELKKMAEKNHLQTHCFTYNCDYKIKVDDYYNYIYFETKEPFNHQSNYMKIYVDKKGDVSKDPYNFDYQIGFKPSSIMTPSNNGNFLTEQICVLKTFIIYFELLEEQVYKDLEIQVRD